MERLEKYIPRDYLGLKILYRRRQFEQLPEVKLVYHKIGGVLQKRVMIGTHKYRLDSDKGRKCMDMYNRRTRLQQELTYYEALWSSHFVGEIPPDCMPHKVNRRLRVTYDQSVVMNKAFFDGLKNDSNTAYPKPKSHYYNGTYYRSAAEKEIAVFLTDSGIPFKYEPEISLVGLSSTVTPDFVLYIEEIDTCIILEHLGIRSSIDYERESKLKYGNFTSAGLVIGMDFLFTHDNEVAVFDLRSLESKLNEAIYELLVCSRISITSKAPYN